MPIYRGLSCRGCGGTMCPNCALRGFPVWFTGPAGHEGTTGPTGPTPELPLSYDSVLTEIQAFNGFYITAIYDSTNSRLQLTGALAQPVENFTVDK